MPSSLGGGIVEAGTVCRLLRREWGPWSALRTAGLPRLPAYGDYSVQHPNPPAATEDGQIPIGMRGSIRYTHHQDRHSAGKGPRWKEGHEQYRKLCKVLVDQPEFLGREFTWGDRQITECADGIIEPAWERLWCGAGTAHHLRFVVDKSRNLRDCEPTRRNPRPQGISEEQCIANNLLEPIKVETCEELFPHSDPHQN
jgi:hypothetical protein